MRRLKRLTVGCGLLLAPIALLGAANAMGDSPGAMTAITPVFTQLVMFSLPAEFKSPKATYERNSGSFYIREQVPDGETLGKWSRMVTFSTAAPGVQKVDGYDAYEVITSCGRVQSGKDFYSESAIMLTVKGRNDYYTLQWIERGRDSAQAQPVDVGYWTKQLARLNPIRLCPIVPGESAPYPSCARR